MSLPLLLLVMSLVTYRLTRLLVKDTFPPVLWLRDRIVGGWRLPTMKEQHHESFPTGEVDEHALKAVPGLGTFRLIDGELHLYARRVKWSPYWLAELLSCPWCASAYVSWAVVWATAWQYSVPAPLLVWPAVWAVGALIAAQEWA